MYRYFWIGIALIIAGLSAIMGFWPAVFVIAGVYCLLVYFEKFLARNRP